MIDWSVGSYERTAAELERVSEEVVVCADLAAGDRVLDIACGTGNAALAAARRGARVIGVDLAERLVLVAGQRARAAGLEVQFLVGDAQALPVPDASADVVLSVFGLIFAPDQRRTAAELSRVLAPGGRAAVTAWVPEGALAAVGAAMARAIADAAGSPAPPAGGPPPVRWGDPEAARGLFAPGTVDLAAEQATIPFTAVSPEAWEEDQAEHHPLWITAQRTLGEAAFAALEREILRILHAANEDPTGFRITSRYVITTITKR